MGTGEIVALTWANGAISFVSLGRCYVPPAPSGQSFNAKLRFGIFNLEAAGSSTKPHVRSVHTYLPYQLPTLSTLPLNSPTGLYSYSNTKNLPWTAPARLLTVN